MATSRPYRVLFLCTGNSARSIVAECALNRRGAGRFQAFSAGSAPAGRVHPMTLALLRELGHPTETLRSKSWDEFARPDTALRLPGGRWPSSSARRWGLHFAP
jgi:arsenate reductase